MNKLFRYTCLLLLIGAVLTGCSGGCSSDQQSMRRDIEESEPLALILKHRSDPASADISKQVSQTLDYTKIPYKTTDMAIGTPGFDIPESAELIYFATNLVEPISDENIERLVEFVARGNQVVFLTPIYDDRFAYLLSMKTGTEYAVTDSAQGFYFQEDIFPAYQGERYQSNPPFVHGGFEGSQFIDEKQVIAHAANNPNYPVIVERQIGNGRSIYFNTAVMGEKNYRGLLFSAGLKALEGVPYQVANVSTIFLDDFPAPLYDTKLEPIDQEYDTTHANFVTRIWWPDMKALADTFDISYSAMLAFNYNAVVVPPFDFNEWEKSKLYLDGRMRSASAWLARDVRDSRHELAFHGYNHFSLWLKDWENMQFMQSSLQAARKRWTIDNLGPLPETYVPPTNNIDSVGLRAIELTMPSIDYMSSLYLGDVSEGGGREFGPDPIASELFAYPRISSGFTNSDLSKFNQHNLSLYTGIWTHFVHPDDVFQVNQRDEDDYRSRNPLGLGWHSDPERDYGLYEVFRERLEGTVDRYPLTRFLTAQESAPIVRRWLNTHNNYSKSESDIEITSERIETGYNIPEPSYWFSYVSDQNQPEIEELLTRADVDFKKSSLWDGDLYQFQIKSDTLHFPILKQQRTSRQLVTRTLENYRASLTPDDGTVAEQTQWTDTRLAEAKQAYSTNPDSRQAQEQLIELAVEFDSTKIALPILERRLMNNATWHSNDVERLLTYYGWVGETERAFNFLEKLWSKYQDSSIITLKNMMTVRYGVPSEEFRERWLQRAYQLNPNEPALLRQLVEQSESWSEREKYLMQLIETNPESDSLYAYAVEQSLNAGGASETAALVQSFPDSAYIDRQLTPYANQIAYRYADLEEYTRAGMWAQKSDSFPIQTQLYWLMEQQRYQEFINRSQRYMAQQPQNDSLRTYVGQQLIYQGFAEQGYETLYPLFEEQKASDEVKQLVHTEIGYMGYDQKKSFYKSYPAFFSDSLAANIRDNYRRYEGFKVGATASLASDNFNNNTGSLGLFAEWGHRQRYTHRITVSDRYVSSDIAGGNNFDNLYNINYRYQRNFSSQTKQLTLGGGVYSDGRNARPSLNSQYWVSVDSTYTSIQLQQQPVFTNEGIAQNINQVRASLYREDYWQGDLFQSTLSVTGSWYSDNNIGYEALTKLYLHRTFSTQLRKIRPLIDLSYADAQTSYTNGRPYYTPNGRFTKGIGVDVSYQDATNDPDFSTGVELMAKHSNRDGTFATASGRLSARINKFWELSLNGYLSTSRVYRYNNVSLSISYTFPRKLKP